MNDLTRSENMPINKVDRIGDNNWIWKFVFNGPEATAYEDGIFKLKFIFPNDYTTVGLKLYLWQKVSSKCNRRRPAYMYLSFK